MFENRKVLFVEDDPQEVSSIITLFKQLRMSFVHVATVSEAVRELVSSPYEYVLTDLHIETKAGFERPDGLVVVRAAVEQQPNVIIVATSSDPRTEIVDAVLAAGAQHFVRKPLSKVDELEIAFKMADQRRQLKRSTEKQTRPKTSQGHWDRFAKQYPHGIIQDDYIQRVARLAARKKASCVITGETGTGKEEAAKLIHRFRAAEEGIIPFVAVNCATITGNLAESLLFGHKKGAFTGAEETAAGYVAEADGGILFLDEIQTLSIPVQQKLLRVLNDGTYNRLGETKIHRSNFQLVAATTKDLSLEVEEGRFLVDIQMRMVGLEIATPPLRDRLADVPALLALFLSRKNIVLDRDRFDAIVIKLQTFSWPGNIRQLFKCLEAWLLYCEMDEVEISPENFPLFKDLGGGQRPSEKTVFAGETDFNGALNRDHDFEKITEAFEKSFLESALKRHPSVAECCRAINLPRSTLDAKRRKFGLV
jgi:DNA-binding NtrC family response regulator